MSISWFHKNININIKWIHIFKLFTRFIVLSWWYIYFYCIIDDVLSINNSRFPEFLPLIYPPELEVKETTDTASSASFLDQYLEFDHSGQLSTKIYDKRDDFNFKIINFPNMCQLLLHMVFTSRNWFAMQGPVALFWFPETSSSSEKQATGPGLLKDSPYSIS